MNYCEGGGWHFTFYDRDSAEREQHCTASPLHCHR